MALSAKTPSVQDRSHDIWRQSPSSIEAFFSPKSVAVIGASESPGSVGLALSKNLLGDFKGPVYPVNPRRAEILGRKAYASVADLPEVPELAVIATPAAGVPGVVADCSAAGVRAAIIISAGFKELGAPGITLEKKVLAAARGMRIVGPNCLGVMNPHARMNATFADRMARPGSVAFLSQSGALCTAILDWSFQAHVGFSAFVSIGSMLDVDWGDLIDYLGNDPKTKSILLYMESIGDARSFLSAAREVSLSKPIIVLKAGRSEAAAKAAASHTGSLAGSDRALDAAFSRCGVIRVNEIGELFQLADFFAKQPRPAGRRLSILTNAGGPGVLATDALMEGGGELAPLAEATKASLNAFLPEHWSHANPIDILGDADPARYARAFEAAAKDETTDALLVILTPQSMTDPTATAELLVPAMRASEKPVFASWTGGASVAKGRALLNESGIPLFNYPDQAAQIFNYAWRHQYNLAQIYQTPALSDAAQARIERGRVRDLISSVLASGRTLLTEDESKTLLSLYGIPVVETFTAASPEEAADRADRIGYPVVLKLLSKTITHKTDVGGVRLDLDSRESVLEAYRGIRESVTRLKGKEHFEGVTVQKMIDRGGYELLLGSTHDPQLGPVLAFGSGGQLVEVMKDVELALPPLNETLARRLAEKTRIFRALQGVRGKPAADLPRLFDVIVRFSELVLEEPRICEIDVNPLLVSGASITALDARVVLHPASIPDERLPRPAIRPYPAEYRFSWRSADGRSFTIRPIRPEDEPLLVSFHQTLSEKTVRRRYFRAIGLSERTAHQRLARVCFNDYDREIALVVEPEEGDRRIVAVGRLSRRPSAAEFSMIVADDHQRLGIGHELMRLLMEVARNEGARVITARIQPENDVMKRLCSQFGFRIKEEGEAVLASREL